MLTDAAIANEAEGLGVERACRLVQKTAKSYIGNYDHPGNWAQLAEATQADRVRQGFAANEPLLRTGDLRDSIAIDAPYRNGAETYGYVFSNSPIARYQELGTVSIPPRPFLSTAAMECEPQVHAILAAAFFEARFREWSAISRAINVTWDAAKDLAEE
ncbi:MAG TPA: hypothetical protein VIF88_12500 [Methylocystis sp.]